MEVKLTEEQHEAVFAPLGENIVSAAAGSGKTKVLSERIVERLKSGDTSIDRLLIVTFTRAAASQMRERISKALKKEYQKNGSEFLKRQMSLVMGADICTIDSFCIDVVRRNFFLLDVSPDFVLAEENEMAILREEVICEVLDKLYEEGDENFIKLANNFGNGKNDVSLKEIILKVYSFTRAFANPDKWLDDALRAHIAESEESKALYDIVARETEEQLRDFSELLESGLEYAKDVGIYSYAEVFKGECENFALYLKKSADEIEDGFENFKFGSFAGKKVDESLSEEKAYLQKIHNEAKAFFEKIHELYEMYKAPKGISYPKIKALVGAVKMFARDYFEEKRGRKELEFADCEYLALKALEMSEDARNELRSKYDEIYIDEYQDTNPLQDALFTLVSRKAWGEPNTFIVGDIKQSIYRFRHSDPMLFSEKIENCDREEKSRKMLLTKNFRSRGDVLDGVNNVFENIMRKGTAQVDYNNEHILVRGGKFTEYDKNKCEIYILNGECGGENEDEEDLAREQRESLVVAKKIKEMINEGFLVSDEGKMRPVRYSDIAVLSSALKNKSEMITNIFELSDIPVAADDTKSFFDTLEIRTVISLLKAVDNPLCDIPLASLMRSPIFMFDENELLEIRMNGRGEPFFENVKKECEKSTPLGEKCEKFVAVINNWRERAYTANTEDFISEIVDESGYYSFVGALPGGKSRQENIRSFLFFARKFEQTRYKGLYNFIKYIEKTVEIGGSVEVNGEKSGDRVLLTTIHRSKGLEFPIVFVIGSGAKFNDRDASNAMIINPVGGIAITEREADRRIKYKTTEYKAISMQIVRESHAERMRLLYVAMTRAKEKLIIVGSVKDYEKKSAEWDMYASGKRMSDYHIRGITNYLDYIMSSIDKRFWDVNVVEALPSIVEKTEKTEEKKIFEKNVEVIERLSYMYPYDGVKNIPSKMSVSEIKRLSQDTEESTELVKSEFKKRMPSFFKKTEEVEPTERGTAYHRVMELIALDETDVKKALENFVEEGFMTKKQAGCIDAEKIEKFLRSPLAKRMSRAKRIWREASFTVMIDARDVFENGENEEICVQGTIDCLFEEEDGGLVLVDYKTDYYDEPEEIAEKYKKQLELYEVAVFKRFLKGCDEKILYLLHKGDAVNVI